MMIPSFTDSEKHFVLLLFVSLLLQWMVIAVVSLIRNLWPHRKSILSLGRAFTWRNRYPSFEDLHAFFDRGDIMMAAVTIASTMQISHKEVGNFILAHSTYRSHPWRRLIRTLTFIRMTIRANSDQRSRIVDWLNRIHKNNSLFKFDHNVFVLATIAYGLARAHQVLGSATDIELDTVVSTIMSMADKLNPTDRGKHAPKSLTEVEIYLSSQITFKSRSADLENIQAQFDKLLDIHNSIPTNRLNAKTTFYKPWSYLKLFLLQCLWLDICRSVLFLGHGRSYGAGLLLSVVRMVQPVLYHFHYNICPHTLTFDGIFDLFLACDPSLKVDMDSVYHEVFGEDLGAQTQVGKIAGAHLPQVADSAGPGTGRELTHPSLYQAVLEHLKCSYYRTRLATSGGKVPQHLGVIMDGNRRFAKQNRFGTVVEGHAVGARRLIQFISWSFSAGINNLTLWALSDDNLKRSATELEALFSLMADYIREILMGDTPLAVLDIRFRAVGDRSLLPKNLNESIDIAENATQSNRSFNLQLALGYGGRAEIIRAVNEAVKWHIVNESTSTADALAKLSTSDVSSHTYSAELGLPAIDAILRTSGENRLSGFALWESHAAEICFLVPTWPSMNQSEFLRSIVDLSERQRRFGS